MAHPKDDSRFLDCSLHSEAIVDARSHRFLTQDVISLFGESQGDFQMHVVLNSDYHSICQSFADSLNCFCRRCVKLLPCLKDERRVDIVGLRKVPLCLGPRLRDGHYATLVWGSQGIFAIRLS